MRNIEQQTEDRIEAKRDRSATRFWTIVIAVGSVAAVLVTLVSWAAAGLMDRTSIADRVQVLDQRLAEHAGRLKRHDETIVEFKTAVAVIQAGIQKIEKQIDEQNKKLDRILERRLDAKP